MADLFVLGRLRAPCAALENQIEQLAKSLAIEAEHGFYVDDLAFIPISDSHHFPQTYQSILNTKASDLFVSYDIGRIHGNLGTALLSNFVDVFGDRLHMYGQNSELLRKRLDPESRKWVTCYEVDATKFKELRAQEELEQRRAQQDDLDEYDEEDGDDEFDEEEESDELSDYNWVEYNRVEGEFRTEGLVRWLTKFNEVRFAGARDANLLILVTRANFTEFEESKDGKKLLEMLGPEPAVVMKSTSAAVIAFKYAGSKIAKSEITQQLKPRVIEDFVLLDIGLEVAPMHRNLSPLADWVGKGSTPPPAIAARSSGRRILKPIQN